MISISKLYLDQAETSDNLRYISPALRKPVVVWNLTPRCNLNCLHCYANASGEVNTLPEAGTAAIKAVIANLAEFGVPVLLFSGGEPLLREDLPELAAFTKKLGLRAVVSSNGTLLTPEKAQALKQSGVSYVGISLDGLASTHNRLRQNSAAFDLALAGLDEAREAGLKTGLRVTITRENIGQINGIFALLKEREIDRVCFYHLVGVGRGRCLSSLMPSAAETRRAMDEIIDAVKELKAGGYNKEVLTVDNHADGPYLWMKLNRENPERARQAWNLLSLSGGNSSGVGIAAINWRGIVTPDQFWSSCELGNVFEQPFSKILAEGEILGNKCGEPESSLNFLAKLRNKKKYVQGRCACCRFMPVCGGNFRVRAEAATGNTWAEDPGCYLSDEEIAGAIPYFPD